MTSSHEFSSLWTFQPTIIQLFTHTYTHTHTYIYIYIYIKSVGKRFDVISPIKLSLYKSPFHYYVVYIWFFWKESNYLPDDWEFSMKVAVMRRKFFHNSFLLTLLTGFKFFNIYTIYTLGCWRILQESNK